jgi:hypothetical protein
MEKTAIHQLVDDILDNKIIIPSMINKALELENLQMIKLANHLRNNYTPLAPNQSEWQRIGSKKVLTIEQIIVELSKIK